MKRGGGRGEGEYERIHLFPNHFREISAGTSQGNIFAVQTRASKRVRDEYESASSRRVLKPLMDSKPPLCSKYSLLFCAPPSPARYVYEYKSVKPPFFYSLTLFQPTIHPLSKQCFNFFFFFHDTFTISSHPRVKLNLESDTANPRLYWIFFCPTGSIVYILIVDYD